MATSASNAYWQKIRDSIGTGVGTQRLAANQAYRLEQDYWTARNLDRQGQTASQRSGDSYMRGMDGVDPLQAYDAETRRMGQEQAARGVGMTAMGQLGAAGVGAMGNYGSAVAGSLANQSIAAGNTFGGMANNYYNTLGQMGHMGGALAAAGLAASSNAANANFASDMGMNMGGQFGGGFGVSGPGGGVASGILSPGGGGGGFAGGMGSSIQRGGGADERRAMLGQGFDYLGTAMGHLNNPNNQAMALAGLANDQFNANRDATMNPQFMNSMNNMFNNSGNAMSRMQSGKAPAQFTPAFAQPPAGQQQPSATGYPTPPQQQQAYAGGVPNWRTVGQQQPSSPPQMPATRGRDVGQQPHPFHGVPRSQWGQTKPKAPSQKPTYGQPPGFVPGGDQNYMLDR